MRYTRNVYYYYHYYISRRICEVMITIMQFSIYCSYCTASVGCISTIDNNGQQTESTAFTLGSDIPSASDVTASSSDSSKK